MTPDRAAQIQAIAATLAPELDPAHDYPALAAQAARWGKTRPLGGFRVHMDRNRQKHAERRVSL